MPAPVQITAEQLLREAKERELELTGAVSKAYRYNEVIGKQFYSFVICSQLIL
jgi:hypothetical protein